MTLLGTLLKNRRCGDATSAWNRSNLRGLEQLAVTSPDFVDGGPIPREHVGRRVGGKNLSPELSWSTPPPETVELLLVVEDVDVPLSTPAVHCLALIDPSRLDSPHLVPKDGLSATALALGVRILRSTLGRGYHGPEPIKGHGPHHDTFELFAFADALDGDSDALGRARSRDVLAHVSAPVIARGRLTGVYER